MKAVTPIVASALMSLAMPALADYPNRPVRLIVPFPAGQTTDALARIVAEQLTTSLGQSFYIDNRAGAAGIVGMESAKRAEPDGYTLVVASSGPLAINPSLYPKLPYDTAKDFSAVSMLVAVPQFLVARTELPANTVKELVGYVKTRPGQINYGSGGAGLTNHLTMEMFGKSAGIQMTHVPYRGSTAAFNGLLAGEISMMFESGPVVIPHVKRGVLKVLGVASKSGSLALPEVPTIDKAGVAGFDSQSWAAILAPRGTPTEVIAKLNAAIRQSLDKPVVQRRLNSLGAEPIASSPDEANAYIKREVQGWGKIIRDAHIELEQQ
ncbi:tripartite tricarboxylate transporter substrate binding protein [Diaphorobacter sp. HDW4A]|uniref:Bug family tripartite tricarboxylate transporter substrate binding protein n=1 Tax=Diaphorobacter sp. HDW4A TaxID=2714924 RepID=UPI00140CE3D0|nr:tripartite tricarboxylate transporter substrate binding protein [Diaphorobacter sp. HDW4A]QIL80175.1 tripartite tricarboxylate transporter substrate binding protein [Diaphorobacter sp. HDW4A]